MSLVHLIRHAEKESSEIHSLLSKNGEKEAFKYGMKLKEQGVCIDEIISSPIERCLQTAEYIKDGYGKNLKIRKSVLLGNPGIFIKDDKKAMDAFNKNSLIDIINFQLNENELEGFRNIKIASEMLIRNIKNNIINGKSYLYISHDAVITPFIYFLKGRNKISQNEIVNFLEGYTLKIKFNEIVL